MAIAGLILAAGKGTRMKSELPKGLHAVCGLPMVEIIARALAGAGVTNIAIVVGYGADQIRAALSDRPYRYAEQREQLGTGHAALMAESLFADFDGPILVTPGDTPLVDSDSLKRLLTEHKSSQALCTVATFSASASEPYGRAVRDGSGRIQRIVETRDATGEERTITEMNSAVYCFDAKTLFRILPTLTPDNDQNEFYLTDVVRIIYEESQRTHLVHFEDPALFDGVNDRWQLAQAEAALRQRVLRRHALNGVTLVDPATTYIDQSVEIGADTLLLPGTILAGDTQIGTGCRIGPNTRILDSRIGNNVEIVMSHLDRASMANNTRCGPFANLRPKAVVREGAKIGNFVEIKNAELGERAAVGHLAYIGDATVGAGSNIGAGVITANYDGFGKHRTTIGEGAFVGSNSTLIAPITVGSGAFVAAGSTISRDVRENALAIGRGTQVEKEGWAQRWRARHGQ